MNIDIYMESLLMQLDIDCVEADKNYYENVADLYPFLEATGDLEIFNEGVGEAIGGAITAIINALKKFFENISESIGNFFAPKDGDGNPISREQAIRLMKTTKGKAALAGKTIEIADFAGYEAALRKLNEDVRKNYEDLQRKKFDTEASASAEISRIEKYLKETHKALMDKGFSKFKKKVAADSKEAIDFLSMDEKDVRNEFNALRNDAMAQYDKILNDINTNDENAGVANMARKMYAGMARKIHSLGFGGILTLTALTAIGIKFVYPLVKGKIEKTVDNAIMDADDRRVANARTATQNNALDKELAGDEEGIRNRLKELNEKLKTATPEEADRINETKTRMERWLNEKKREVRKTKASNAERNLREERHDTKEMNKKTLADHADNLAKKFIPGYQAMRDAKDTREMNKRVDKINSKK